MRGSWRRIVAGMLCAGMAIAASAADRVWDGDTDGAWGTPANWDGDATIPAASDNISLPDVTNQVITLGADRTVGNVGFNAADAYVLGGSNLVILSGGRTLAQQGAGTVAISSGINWGPFGAILGGAGAGEATLNALTGSGLITVQGANWTLNADNFVTLAAGTRWALQGGQLSIGNVNRLGYNPAIMVGNYLSFNGGTLRMTASAGNLGNRGIMVDAGGGTIDAGGFSPCFNLSVLSSLIGSGRLVLRNGGRVDTLFAQPAFTGTLQLGNGAGAGNARTEFRFTTAPTHTFNGNFEFNDPVTDGPQMIANYAGSTVTLGGDITFTAAPYRQPQVLMSRYANSVLSLADTSNVTAASVAGYIGFKAGGDPRANNLITIAGTITDGTGTMNVSYVDGGSNWMRYLVSGANTYSGGGTLSGGPSYGYALGTQIAQGAVLWSHDGALGADHANNPITVFRSTGGQGSMYAGILSTANGFLGNQQDITVRPNNGTVAVFTLGGASALTTTYVNNITVNNPGGGGGPAATGVGLLLHQETDGECRFTGDLTASGWSASQVAAPVFEKTGGGMLTLWGGWSSDLKATPVIRNGTVRLATGCPATGDTGGLGDPTVTDYGVSDAIQLGSYRPAAPIPNVHVATLASVGGTYSDTGGANGTGQITNVTNASSALNDTTLVVGDRVLIFLQGNSNASTDGNGSANGIYEVSAVPGTVTLDRTSDAVLPGSYVTVDTIAGKIHSAKHFYLANQNTTFNNGGAGGTVQVWLEDEDPGQQPALLLQGAVSVERDIQVNRSPFITTATLGGLNEDATGTFSGDITLARDLQVSSQAIVGSARTLFAGTIDDGADTCSVTKIGEGRVEFEGANTYDGGTLVSAGTLIIGNSAGSATGSGPVTVAVGATLTGSGAISGTVTVAGTLRPGSSSATGTLAIGSALLDGTCQISLDGAATSLLSIDGDLTITGTASLAVDVLSAPTSLTYTVITYTGTRIGNFDGVTPGYELIYDDANQRIILRLLETYIVTFQANAHGLVDGAGTVTHAVFEGDDCPSATAQPDSGYVFAGWIGDYIGMDNPLTLVNILNDMNVDANFAPSTTLSIEVTPVLGGATIPAPGDVTVGVGIPALVQAFSNPTYGFDHWEVLSGNATLGNAYAQTTTVIVENVGGATIRAIFGTGASLTMATSDPGLGGTMPPPGEYARVIGSPTPIEALPNIGVLFAGWQASANASVADVNAITTTVTLSGDATVTATFAIPDPTLLTLAADPLAGGVTIPDAGTYTVGVGLPFPIGSNLNPGYAFAGWTVTSGNATLGNADLMTTTVTIADTGGADVVANFAPAAVLTMVADPPIGGGTMPAPGPNTVAQGVAIHVGAMPSPGYLFVDWEATANASLADVNAITTTATLSGDATITANFAESAEMTLAAAAGGSTTPASGTYIVPEGVAQAIVATPTEGYHFMEWRYTAQAYIDDSSAATTTATLSGDAAITPVFEINTYTVVFQTDGTPSALVNGALAVTYTVAHGSDCTPVTAEPPAGLDFTGWSGDYVGMDNPLTLTNIVANMTVTASFGKWVAQGLVIELDATDVVDLATPGTFFRKPKFYALYHDPVKDPDQLLKAKKATLKVLTKIDKTTGEAILDCEWTKKIKLYSSKNFKAAQKLGTDAVTWLAGEGNQADLALDLHTSTKESDPIDQSVFGASLPAPEILTVAESLDVELGTLLTIEGTWFGTKKPKVSREYTVDGKGPAIKQQKYKVLKAADPLMIDSKGKMAYMNHVTGVSKVIVVVPTKIPGTLSGILVLDNGVGMATGIDPTVEVTDPPVAP